MARSDIVHHNLTKGVAERLGIDYESLRKIKPDIIYCNTYMYGPEGPLSHLGGNDSLSQALSGLEYEAGPAEEGNPPLYYRFGHTDTTNALASVVGVLAALAHRDRTGEGQDVWTSLLNAASTCNSEVYLTPDGAADPPKLNKSQTGFGALYRLYETQEGGSRSPRSSASSGRLCARAVGRPDLEHDERFATAEGRQSNRAELEAILEQVFLTQTAVAVAPSPQRRRRPRRDRPQHRRRGDGPLRRGQYRAGSGRRDAARRAGRLRQVGNLMRFSDTPSTVLHTRRGRARTPSRSCAGWATTRNGSTRSPRNE